MWDLSQMMYNYHMVLVMKVDSLTLSSRSTGLDGGSLRTCGTVDS